MPLFAPTTTAKPRGAASLSLLLLLPIVLLVCDTQCAGERAANAHTDVLPLRKFVLCGPGWLCV
jgi:hypothetical protein